MAEPRVVLALSAWLLTYLIHSTVLLGGAALWSRLAGRRFDSVAEWAWRTAMFGAVVTTSVQLLWYSTSPSPHRLESSAVARTTSQWTSALPALLGAWLVVAVWRLALFVRAHRALARRTATRVRAILPAADTADVSIVVCDNVHSPMITGAREICMPARAMRELSRGELDAVLAHEMAHIARHDRIWLYATTSVERLFWIQPLNVVATSRLRALAETTCDDWAVRRTGDPIALASALARVASWMIAAPPAGLAIGMASAESLALARVRRILDPSVNRVPSGRGPLRAVVAAMLLTAVVALAPSVSPRSFALAPLSRYVIRAVDDAGPFTLTVERGRVIGMTVGGERLDDARLQQAGGEVSVVEPNGAVALRVNLTPDGGITWSSRRR